MRIRTSQSRYADDRYAVQRRSGFPWLRFIPDLESEYRASYIKLNATRIRVASLLGILSVFGFIGLDQFVGMNLQGRFSDLLLIAVTVPAVFVPFAATFRPNPGAYLLPMVFAAVLLMAESVLAVIVIGRSTHPWFPWEALLVVTTFVFFVSGLMFYQAVLANLVVWVCFVVTNWSVQSHDRLLYEAYYLLIANGVGWLGLYMLEHQSRLAFLMQNELRQQAVLDSLTGLMNRRAFNSHLEAAWLQAQREQTSVGVMLIDLDSFKQMNDGRGHPFGDRALQHIAHVLRTAAMRPLDAAARYGGDEFVAVWYGVDGAWFGRLAQELPQRFAAFDNGNAGEPLAVSGGAVLAWPRPGTTMRDAIRLADEKLYDMKRHQRGQIGFVMMPAGPSARQTAA